MHIRKVLSVHVVFFHNNLLYYDWLPVLLMEHLCIRCVEFNYCKTTPTGTESLSTWSLPHWSISDFYFWLFLCFCYSWSDIWLGFKKIVVLSWTISFKHRSTSLWVCTSFFHENCPVRSLTEVSKVHRPPKNHQIVPEVEIIYCYTFFFFLFFCSWHTLWMIVIEKFSHWLVFMLFPLSNLHS